MPELVFLPDKGWEQAERLEKLFQVAKEGKE
jgi:ribosome-binding factor A